MSASPDRILNIRLPSVTCIEEYIAHQLAVIGLQLHKLGRLESYRRVIDARNELLDILDQEFMLQGNKNKIEAVNFPLDTPEPAVLRSRARRSGLKTADRLR